MTKYVKSLTVRPTGSISIKVELPRTLATNEERLTSFKSQLEKAVESLVRTNNTPRELDIQALALAWYAEASSRIESGKKVAGTKLIAEIVGVKQGGSYASRVFNKLIHDPAKRPVLRAAMKNRFEDWVHMKVQGEINRCIRRLNRDELRALCPFEIDDQIFRLLWAYHITRRRDFVGHRKAFRKIVTNILHANTVLIDRESKASQIRQGISDLYREMQREAVRRFAPEIRKELTE